MLHPRGHCSNTLHCLFYMGECLLDTVRDCDISHTIAKCVPASSTHAFIAYTSTRLLIQVATSCYSPSSSEKTKSITLFSLCMHITRQLCQVAMHVPVPLPPEKVNRLHHRMDALVLGSWQNHHHIHRCKEFVTTASDAHTCNNISVAKASIATASYITAESIIFYLRS